MNDVFRIRLELQFKRKKINLHLRLVWQQKEFRMRYTIIKIKLFVLWKHEQKYRPKSNKLEKSFCCYTEYFRCYSAICLKSIFIYAQYAESIQRVSKTNIWDWKSSQQQQLQQRGKIFNNKSAWICVRIMNILNNWVKFCSLAMRFPYKTRILDIDISFNMGKATKKKTKQVEKK